MTIWAGQSTSLTRKTAVQICKSGELSSLPKGLDLSEEPRNICIYIKPLYNWTKSFHKNGWVLHDLHLYSPHGLFLVYLLREYVRRDSKVSLSQTLHCAVINYTISTKKSVRGMFQRTQHSISAKNLKVVLAEFSNLSYTVLLLHANMSAF